MIHRSTIGLALLVGLLLAAIPCALAQSPAAAGTATFAITNSGTKTYTVPAGTRIPLSLKNEISTRSAMPGDPVYLMSDFPVVEEGEVLLPAGMYVRGIIDSVQRPGKVKGRAQLQMHFTSIILPNGIEVPLPGSLDELPGTGGARIKNGEGTVEQDGSKGKDTQRVASNTLEGAGVGGLVGVGTGNVAKGSGIGAGAGAAVGILTTLFTRGNDIVIQEGTTMEMKLSRPLVLQQSQLAGMPASTGVTIAAPVTAPQSRSAAALPTN
jgi:type IV secretion system protein VirB10